MIWEILGWGLLLVIFIILIVLGQWGIKKAIKAGSYAQCPHCKRWGWKNHPGEEWK